MPHDNDSYDTLRDATINSPSPDVKNEEVPGFGTLIDHAQRGDGASEHTVHDVVQQWPARPAPGCAPQPPFDPGWPGEG